MRKFRTLCEILLMVFEKFKLSVFNLASYAKKHRVCESFVKSLCIIFENNSSRSSNSHPLRISTGFANSKFTLRIKFADHFFRTPTLRNFATLRKFHFAKITLCENSSLRIISTPHFSLQKKKKKKRKKEKKVLHLPWNPSKVLGVYGESLWSLCPKP